MKVPSDARCILLSTDLIPAVLQSKDIQMELEKFVLTGTVVTGESDSSDDGTGSDSDDDSGSETESSTGSDQAGRRQSHSSDDEEGGSGDEDDIEDSVPPPKPSRKAAAPAAPQRLVPGQPPPGAAEKAGSKAPASPQAALRNAEACLHAAKLAAKGSVPALGRAMYTSAERTLMVKWASLCARSNPVVLSPGGNKCWELCFALGVIRTHSASSLWSKWRDEFASSAEELVEKEWAMAPPPMLAQGVSAFLAKVQRGVDMLTVVTAYHQWLQGLPQWAKGLNTGVAAIGPAAVARAAKHAAPRARHSSRPLRQAAAAVASTTSPRGMKRSRRGAQLAAKAAELETQAGGSPAKDAAGDATPPKRSRGVLPTVSGTSTFAQQQRADVQRLTAQTGAEEDMAQFALYVSKGNATEAFTLLDGFLRAHGQ